MACLYNPSDLHRDMRDAIAQWASTALAPGAALRDQSAAFDAGLWAELSATLGLVGFSVPVAHGGLGMDASAVAMVFEELSRVDASFALSYLAHELLFLHLLAHSLGADAQKRYLQTRVGALAMTEPHSGTDVLDMRTWAKPVEGGYVLDGEKQWISNAPIAEAFLVYAKTGEGRKDISLFLVDANSEGLKVGVAEEKMGMRSSPTGGIVFNACFVPKTHLVGALHGALPGLMRNLALERIGLAAMSLGIAASAFEIMQNYAKERQAFGRRIIEFGQIQAHVAQSFSELHAARALVYDVATRLDDPLGQSLADAAKIEATTMAERVCRRAIQCLGANGYSEDYPVERYLRDAILLSIGGGTTEALQRNIARHLARR